MTLKQLQQNVLCATAVVLGPMIAAPLAPAQSVRPMSPTDQQAASQPRLSPYLNLLRPDNSASTPYHSFVRPQQQLFQLQALQATELGRLESSLSSNRRSDRKPMEGKPPERLTTGNGARFQSYSHFYRFDQPRP